MTKSKLLVSAIVTNYNGWGLGLLNDFFRSFLKQPFKNFEIFLVDNASSDESVMKVSKKFGSDKRLKIIQNPVNVMSAGINMALKQAQGKYILFLNNDIYLEKNAIKNMVHFLEKNRRVASVQGKLVSYFDHSKIDDVGESMDIFGNPVTLGAGEKDQGQYEKQREILSASGTCSLTRRDLIKKVGLLDDSYHIGYEDMDLSLKLRISGYKIFFISKVLVFHRRGSSVSRASDQIRVKIKFDFNKNRLATLIKNYQFSTLVKIIPVVLLIYLAAGLIEIFYKRLWRFGLSRFQAVGWIVLYLPTILKKRHQIQSLRRLDDQEAFVDSMEKGKLLTGLANFLGSKKW